MIKLVIFDLDGVLVETRNMHYFSLNFALEKIDPKYVIDYSTHMIQFNGLPTKTKLDILSEERGLPRSLHQTIWTLKQQATKDYLLYELEIDPEKSALIKKLVADGIRVGIASNAIQDTVATVMERMGVNEIVEIVSNDMVVNPKPHPEMYLNLMRKFNTTPLETLIVEDSPVGHAAVKASKAHLLAVQDSSDVTIDLVYNKIKEANVESFQKHLQVIIPAAGNGSRFVQYGYSLPKPLIDIHGKPMLQVVVENLGLKSQFIFLVRTEHYNKFGMQSLLDTIAPGSNHILVEHLTEGAACTALLAKEYLDPNKPLLIANSDQYMVWDIQSFIQQVDDADGGIICFNATDPKWSFVKVNAEGWISEVVEKNPISDIATVGVYYWKRANDFIEAAEQMIAKNIRVNNEFYIAPTFNELILAGKKIKPVMINTLHGLGTPEDLERFKQLGIQS